MTLGSYITYYVSVYNKTDREQVFIGPFGLTGEGLYDNDLITYELGNLVPYQTILEPGKNSYFTITFKYAGNDTSKNTLTSKINFRFMEKPELAITNEGEITGIYPGYTPQEYEFKVSNYNGDKINNVALSYGLTAEIQKPFIAKIYDANGTEVISSTAIDVAGTANKVDHTYKLKILWDNTNAENGVAYNNAEYAGKTYTAKINMVATPKANSEGINKYEDYQLTQAKDVTVRTAPMNLTAELNNTTIEMTNNRAEINLAVNNNNGSEYNLYETKYTISQDNTKYILYVDEVEYTNNITEERTIGTGEKITLVEKIWLVPKQGSTLDKEETANITINITSPYTNKTETIQVKVQDTKGPSAPTITGGSEGYTTGQTISVSKLATDVGTGVQNYEYLVNNTGQSVANATGNVGSTEAETSKTFDTDYDGYYIWFRAVDAVGNKGEWSNSQQLNIDTTGPSAPTITGGNSSYDTTSLTISVNTEATDSLSGVVYYEYYKTTSSTVPTATTTATGAIGTTATEKSKTFSENIAGEYIYFRAVDKVGNKGTWSTAQRMYIDTNKPTVSVKSTATEEVEEETDIALSTYFNTDKNGNAGISSTVFTDTSNGNAVVTTTKSLEVGTHVIRYTVTKENGLSAYADKIITIVSAVPNITTATSIQSATTEYQDAKGNTLVVPGGFKARTDLAETVDKGIVIEDGDGNQFVWVPIGEVTRSDGEVVNIEFGRYSDFSLTATPAQYAKDEGWNATVTIDSYYQELTTYRESLFAKQLPDNNATAKSLQTFISNAIDNGGYYIARYEASFGSGSQISSVTNGSWSSDAGGYIAGTKAITNQRPAFKQSTSASSSSDMGTVTSTPGMLWNYIRQGDASLACQNLYAGNEYNGKNFVDCDLINSYAWDTAIMFIQFCSEKTDYANQTSLNSALYNTGTDSGKTTDIACNIYDMAGNLCEWTTEYVIWDETPQRYSNALYRGGRYGSSGNNANRDYGCRSTSEFAYSGIGFRAVLYCTPEEEVTVDTDGSWNDDAGVNNPYLMDGMVAVYWSYDGGATASTTDEGASPIYSKVGGVSTGADNPNFVWNNWYKYVSGDNATDTKTSRWANAVTDDGSYWVWIPRFKYLISEHPTEAGVTNAGKIDVKFIPTTDKKGASGYTTSTSGEILTKDSNGYIIHPAFENGSSSGKNNGYANGEWDSELPGFWVAKYEMSMEDGSGTAVTTGSSSVGNVKIGSTVKMVSKPNVSSWRYIQIGQIYQNCLLYDSAKNSHMIKDSEWGAIAYLAHSQYGRNGNEITINDSEGYYTGNAGDSPTDSSYQSGIGHAYNTTAGMLASTTGNIYGVYDMSGGAHEYTASWDTASTYSYIGDYGKAVDGTVYFTQNGSSDKYKTAYSNGTTNTYYGSASQTICKTGDGIRETWVTSDCLWFNDFSHFVCSDAPFLCRGGYYYDWEGGTGVFSSHMCEGVREIISFRAVLAGRRCVANCKCQLVSMGTIDFGTLIEETFVKWRERCKLTKLVVYERIKM